MAKRPTLTDVTSLTNSSAINTLNQNWDAIQEAFDNTLSLDGSTPNAMEADLDLNGNALLNVGIIDTANLTLDGQTITDIASVPEWRGAWVTATSYAKNDLVKTAGNVYICLVAHTSAAAFSTDLTALRWELMVSKGDSGAGTGDLLSTNNLSDLSNPTTARSNLGLGTAAVESVVPVTKGGTGATDAATALTNLGALSSANGSVTFEKLAGASVVTSSETIATNNNDTTIPTSAAVKGYTDSQTVGVGQTWQNVLSSRFVSTDYTNNTGRPIMVNIQFTQGSSFVPTTIFLVNGLAVAQGGQANIAGGGMLSVIVPAGATYRCNSPGGNAPSLWVELR